MSKHTWIIWLTTETARKRFTQFMRRHGIEYISFKGVVMVKREYSFDAKLLDYLEKQNDYYKKHGKNDFILFKAYMCYGRDIREGEFR